MLAAAWAAERGAVAPLRAGQRAAGAEAARAARTAAGGSDTADARLARFREAFPAPDALAGALAGLDEAAGEAGVPLRSAEYRLEERAGDGSAGRLARYRIALRTTGSYAQIRAFLGRLLERHAFVALDDVQFRRAADASLEADVRLSLYLRRP